MTERPAGPPKRWPGWVYGTGEEPDYRFSFANERTFLAWIRTALALLAAGVALDSVELAIPERAQHALAAFFVGVGFVAALGSWVRWSQAERAMRSHAPLPSFGLGALLTCSVVGAAAALLVLVV